MRRRLLFSYLSITLFVLIALGVPLGLSYASAERRRLQQDVERDAFSLALRAAAYSQDVEKGSTTGLERAIRDYESARGASVVVIGPDGVVVAPPNQAGINLANDSIVNAARRGREASDTRDDPRLGPSIVVGAPIVVDGASWGVVRVTFSRVVTDRRIAQNWLLLGGLAGVITLVVLLVSTLFAQSLTRPLTALEGAASRLGDGDLGVRVPVPSDPPELRGLAQSFNTTATHLEELVRSQQAFIADASHQLRTPLAALRLRLENLEAEAPVALGDDLERALAEVMRLSNLVDGLLVLARAENGGPGADVVDIAAVLEGRVDAWAALADERGVTLDVVTAPLTVRSVPGRLEQVLDNLLNNALEAAPRGSSVALRAKRDGADAVLEVVDEGPGMTPDQRVRAFDRFWRADGSRREHAGFGLGLPIVRQLVRADGGDVSLGERDGGGLAVEIRLPAGPDPVRPPAAGRERVDVFV